MAVNLKFLIITYFVSLFVDWVFQAQWQANNKSLWKPFRMPGADGKTQLVTPDRRISAAALLSHSFVYAVLTAIPVQMVLSGSFAVFAQPQLWWMLAALFVTHAAIDTRIPVKWIMRCKGLTNEQIADVQTYGFLHIGIDHRLHELVLLVMAFFVK